MRQSSRRGASRRLWPLALGALVLVLIAAVLLRAATEHVPPPTLKRTLASQVVLPGRAPTLAWPTEGEAAVEVEGVGDFGASGVQSPAPIASVAKMMTAYLTLREHPLSAGQSGFTLTVTSAQVAEERRRAGEGQSVVPVRAGERLTEREALQALLLPSANNVAAILAVHDAGSIEAFVAQMNAEAKALDMRSTTYTDPSGFTDTTVSTAADQLKLAKVAMSDSTFAAIVDMRAATLPVAGTVTNYDGLVGEEGYVGVKTGSDKAAGGCLVFAKRVRVDGHRLTVLGVVLGQRDDSLIEAAIESARQLGDSAARALRLQTAVPAHTPVLTLTSADGRQTTVRTTHAIKAIGWPGLRMPLQLQLVHHGATLQAGQRLASVQVKGAITSSTPASMASSIGTPSLGWRLSHLL